ncbi:MAG: hypothetical protein LAN70_15660 [Acidobacteriia bacterium]|nr:hypothetical protein [Terriglobia bacterium]
MANQTQADPTRPGYWLDLRQPLPKPGDYKPQPKPTEVVSGGGESPAELATKIAHAVGLRELAPFIQHVLELEQRIATLELLVGSKEFTERKSR